MYDCMHGGPAASAMPGDDDDDDPVKRDDYGDRSDGSIDPVDDEGPWEDDDEDDDDPVYTGD